MLSDLYSNMQACVETKAQYGRIVTSYMLTTYIALSLSFEDAQMLALLGSLRRPQSSMSKTTGG